DLAAAVHGPVHVVAQPSVKRIENQIVARGTPVAMRGRMGSFTYDDEVQPEPLKTAQPNRKAAPAKPAPAKPADPKAAPGGGDLDYAAPYVDEQPENKKDTSLGASGADKALAVTRTNETSVTKDGVEHKDESHTTVQAGQVSKVAHGTKETHGANEHEREDEIGGGVRDGKVVVDASTARTVRDDKT